MRIRESVWTSLVAHARDEAPNECCGLLVGSAEANPAELKLSNESPVGKAIIGKKKGETVEVSTPRGSLKYKILDIAAA